MAEQTGRKSPHVLLEEWYGQPNLDWVSIRWLTSQFRDLLALGYPKEELIAMLRDIESDLICGKLTQDTDAVLQMLGEVRAAYGEVESFEQIRLEWVDEMEPGDQPAGHDEHPEVGMG